MLEPCTGFNRLVDAASGCRAMGDIFMVTQREQAKQGAEATGAKQGRSGSSSSGARVRAGAAAEPQKPLEAKQSAPTEAEDAAPSEDVEEQADEDSEADEREGTEILVAMLVGLAQMDSEAAFAYETAAELADLSDVRSRLLEFAADHRRHVTELGQAIREIGGEPAAAAPPPDTSVFGVLTSALGMVGPRALLMGLIGNEEFTNSAYDTALELITDAELRRLIERNFADEQRHITWLATQARPSEEEEPMATGEN
jgi:rubrerythrin